MQGQRLDVVAEASRLRVRLPISEVNRRQAAHEGFKLVNGEELNPRERDDLVEALADLFELLFARQVCIVMAFKP